MKRTGPRTKPVEHRNDGSWLAGVAMDADRLSAVCKVG